MQFAKAAGIITLGAVICAGAILLGDYDDAPGASVAGFVIFAGSIVLGLRMLRRSG